MLKKVTIFSSVFIIALLLGEEGLRLSGYRSDYYDNNAITRRYIEMNHRRYFYPDSALGWRLAPGHFYLPLEDNKFSEANHDSLGYRITSMHTFSPPLSDSIRKLFVFGCSFTYGVYMLDSESLAFRLQDSLTYMKVYDMAVPAYGDIQSLISLRQSIKSGLLPDIVILDYSHIHDERNFFNLEWQKKISHERLSFKDIIVPIGRIVNDTLQIQYQKPDYHALPASKYSVLVNLIDDTKNKLSINPQEESEVSYQTIMAMANTCTAVHARFILAGIDEDPQTLVMLKRCQSAKIETISLSDDCLSCSNPPDGNTHSIYSQKLFNLLKSK